MAWRSVVVFVSFAACVASSVMRCRALCISFSAPSAVWIREMPSCTFAVARSSPRICQRIFSEMLRPAASSAERLMRKPEESFSVDFRLLSVVAFNWRPAFAAVRLCETVIDI